MILARLKSKRASGMVIACFVLLLLFALGLSFLGVASSSLITSKRDVLRARAMAAAEAGVELASTYLLTQGPDGEENGEWRTFPKDTTHDKDHVECNWYWAPSNLGLPVGDTFRLCVRDGSGPTAGKVIVTSVGIATQDGAPPARKTITVVLDYNAENVNVWNNVIFAGMSQAGKSINGNVVMRGSIHLLGDGEDFTDVDNDGHWDDNEGYIDTNKNGKYDLGEPYDDIDGDGHRDAREPFKDVNGNGIRDEPLNMTDMAEEISGTANIGNNYNGIPAGLKAKLPDLPETVYNGESVDTLNAKLRVKHGRVSISGSATVGDPNVAGNAVKETLSGTYVTDGYTGNKGAASVYSDNGHGNGYDLGDGLVTMPVVSDPYNGYPSYMDYLQKNATIITGDQTIAPGTAVTISGPNGSFVMDKNGNATITGIVYVNGNISLGSKDKPITYSGSGTLAASGNIDVHGDVLPLTNFPENDALGLIARRKMGIATGGGDSQLTMCLAMYAQEQVSIGKQCKIAGTLVSSQFDMRNVPHIYQVPALTENLPPGMPGGDPIYIKSLDVESWQEEMKNY